MDGFYERIMDLNNNGPRADVCSYGTRKKEQQNKIKSVKNAKKKKNKKKNVTTITHIIYYIA